MANGSGGGVVAGSGCGSRGWRSEVEAVGPGLSAPGGGECPQRRGVGSGASWVGKVAPPLAAMATSAGSWWEGVTAGPGGRRSEVEAVGPGERGTPGEGLSVRAWALGHHGEEGTANSGGISSGLGWLAWQGVADSSGGRI